MSRAYYVMIWVLNREPLLSEVSEGEVRLTSLGQAVHEAWNTLPRQFRGVQTDSLVVLPTYAHGVLFAAAEDDTPPGGSPVSLRRVMRAFKSLSTLTINALIERDGGRFWDRGYEAHPAEDDAQVDAMRLYIAESPRHWDSDAMNPANSAHAG